MSKIKIVLPAAILLGGFLLCTTSSYGTVEYAKQTKKGCAYCHTAKSVNKDNAKDLTDPGKCFSKKKTLDGCEEKK